MTLRTLGTAPRIHHDGSRIGIQPAHLAVRWHYRDQLATAILLWLDAADSGQAKEAQSWQVRRQLAEEHGINGDEARLLTITASLCIAHNIEP
ncbi:hypothetical protein ACIBCR_15335 [Micromonospora echinospora]|uniref:hypothetical protein n=1 Tax=Micromonospora echinospora TaxID=1877 RepID=UPI0037AFBB2F